MSPILPDATHCITCRFRHAECWWIWHLCPWSSLLEGKSDGIITTWHDLTSRRRGGRSHCRKPRRVARRRTHPNKRRQTERPPLTFSKHNQQQELELKILSQSSPSVATSDCYLRAPKNEKTQIAAQQVQIPRPHDDLAKNKCRGKKVGSY